jgi:hypothetical protein
MLAALPFFPYFFLFVAGSILPVAFADEESSLSQVDINLYGLLYEAGN